MSWRIWIEGAYCLCELVKIKEVLIALDGQRYYAEGG